MGKIVRRLTAGYEPVAEWSADDDQSFAKAQEILEHELGHGYIAVLSEHGHNDPVTELPRDAEKVILITAMGGG